MSLTVVFRPAARAELDTAVAWYEEQKAGLGASLEAAVELVLTEAVARPTRFPINEGDAREAVDDGFPYCVYYRVRSPRLIVIAVYHQSRDPSGWRGRA